MKDYLSSIIDDVQNIVGKIDRDELKGLASLIISKKRVFVCGTGRSLLMMKAFAMRMVHLGMTVYVVGDINTPAITNDDILIIGSGSGETSTLKIFEEKAKKNGATVAHLTTKPESTIAKAADYVVKIPGSTNHLSNSAGSSWQPAGNSFEQSVLLACDAISMMLADELGVDISSTLALHANLE